MRQITYRVLCGTEGCTELARFKIAAEWSNGTTRELKTYGLACEQHLEAEYRRSLLKQQSCRLTEGERLSPPEIFRLEPGRRDRELVRLQEIESRFRK